MVNNFLFNFAVSYSGGGFKRLYAYADWFNKNGGAAFIVHENCSFMKSKFPENRFFIVNQSQLQRIVKDCDYLKEVKSEIGIPDFYYSYGIPIYYKFGKLNWFHLSNVLPLGLRGIPLPVFDKFKLWYLGHRITSNFKNADIISAESAYSLSLIKPKYEDKFIVSVNGSDDELMFFHSNSIEKKDKIAIILGTYSYKALEDSYQVYQMLRVKDEQLKLIIIGDDKKIPNKLRNKQNVVITGKLPRNEVVSYLQKAQYYISTTYIENSYNAASEGVFFADESYISDIGPHRELLKGLHFEKKSVYNVKRPMLHLKKDEISPLNLKNWDQVIREMIAHISRNNIDFCFS